MWETTKQIFQSQHPLSGIVYLFLGAIIGAVLGTHSSLKAQRPKLKYGGHGGGGDQKKQA